MDEQWRPWPDNPRYLVSDQGRVLGLHGQIRRAHPNKGDYLLMCVRDGRGREVSRSVHVMVCEAFHGPRPAGMEAAHGNGNRRDNRAENLSWKTPRANMDDAMRHGKMRGPGEDVGERHHLAALTEERVRDIRAEYSGRHGDYSRLARKHGVHVNTIRQVVHRVTWKHVT